MENAKPRPHKQHFLETIVRARVPIKAKTNPNAGKQWHWLIAWWIGLSITLHWHCRQVHAYQYKKKVKSTKRKIFLVTPFNLVQIQQKVSAWLVIASWTSAFSVCNWLANRLLVFLSFRQWRWRSLGGWLIEFERDPGSSDVKDEALLLLAKLYLDLHDYSEFNSDSTSKSKTKIAHHTVFQTSKTS